LFIGRARRETSSRVGRRGRKPLALVATLVLSVTFFVVFAAGEAGAQPTVAERHAVVTDVEVPVVASGGIAQPAVETAPTEVPAAGTVSPTSPPAISSPVDQPNPRTGPEPAPQPVATPQRAPQRGPAPGSFDRYGLEVSFGAAQAPSQELGQGLVPDNPPSKSADLEPSLPASELVRGPATGPVPFGENAPLPSELQEAPSELPQTEVQRSPFPYNETASSKPIAPPPFASVREIPAPGPALPFSAAEGSPPASKFLGGPPWDAASRAVETLPDAAADFAASAAGVLGALTAGSPPDSPTDGAEDSSTADPSRGAPQQPSSPPVVGSSFSLSGGQANPGGGVGPLLLCVLVSGLIVLRPSGRLSRIFCGLPKPSSNVLGPLERPG
jgi:hypothetical protein